MKTLGINEVVRWDSAIGIAEGKIVKVVKRGKVPDVAIDISASVDNPAYQIELLRDGQSTGIFIGKHHSDLSVVSPVEIKMVAEMPESEDEEETDLFPPLTQAQADKINKYRPKGAKEILPNEMVVIEFVAADNLINRGRGKWREKDLKKMVDFFNSLGIPFISDHDWENIKKTLGIVIEGRLLKTPFPPNEILSAAGNKDANTEIVRKEGGYIQAIATVALPVDSDAIERLRYGMGRSVSLGGFSFRDYICPICETSFSDKNCPHYIPDYWAMWEAEDPSLIAPYYIRDGLYDVGELANVVIPNLPGAIAVS